MKKHLRLATTKSVLPLSLLLTLVFTNSCKNEKDDGPCGPVLIWTANVDPVVDVNITATNGSKITYYLEPPQTAEKICAQKHVYCVYEVESFTKPDDTSFSLKGLIYWKDTFQEEVSFTSQASGGGTLHKATKEIGLKQAFGTSEAWLGMILLVTFDNKGSTQANKDFLKATFKKIQFVAEYAQH